MALVTIHATRPWCCVVCGGDERVEIRSVDDPESRPDVIPCPHCGAFKLPAVYMSGARTA